MASDLFAARVSSVAGNVVNLTIQKAGVMQPRLNHSDINLFVGKQRRLALRVEQLTASISSAKQEIIFLKEALEAEKNEFEKNKMRQDNQPVTPPVPHFLKLTYDHPSTQPLNIAGRPHDPESTAVSLTWDSPISQYYKLDSYYLPPPSSFQSTDYADDEDAPMVDLDSIIYLDHLAA